MVETLRQYIINGAICSRMLTPKHLFLPYAITTLTENIQRNIKLSRLGNVIYIIQQARIDKTHTFCWNKCLTRTYKLHGTAGKYQTLCMYSSRL